jgi:hypothetical protein
VRIAALVHATPKPALIDAHIAYSTSA